MKKTFFKNLFRDIRKTLSRFLSIVIIIAVGVSFYAGVRATSPDMKMSGDYYFKENKLMDFKLISTLGLTDKDIEEVKKQRGITEAEGSYSLDAVIEKNKQTLVLNINSLPGENGINRIRMINGRKPENNKGAVVEEGFLRENNLKIGDKIVLKSGSEEKIEDSLKNNEFMIVGAAESPLYISEQRQLSSVGSGSVRGFVYIVPDVFKSDVYTEIYVRTDSYESRNSLLYNENYNKSVDKIEKALKDLGVIRSEARYAEILGDANKKIAEAEARLNKARQEGLKKFSESKKDIQEAQRKVDENTKKLKTEEAKANKSLREGEAEIQKNKDKLRKIKKPEWYVLGREANVGYETYRQDSDRIDNIGKAFPLIFFLVAALVSLTTMTRMVQEKRIEIGTFKALGYSRLSIVSHYLIYSLSASLIGSIIGISIGFRLFPPLIMNAYSSLYTIPYSITPFNTKLTIQSSLIAVLFITIAAVAATLEELREVPASLMRPKSPKSGKRILLERVDFIWKRLSFTKKAAVRNIFRYKQRFFMTVIGIAACTGLMITGFGLKGGIIGATEMQFNKIYKYDIRTTLTRDIDTEEKDKIKSRVERESNIKSVLFTYLKNSSVKKGNSTREDAYVVVPENNADFNNYINLTMDDIDLKLNDDGVIITEKLSRLINKNIGDTIEITVGDKVIKAKISSVTEHYIQHYIYISPKYYERVTGEKLRFNSFYGLLKSTSQDSEDITLKNLRSIGDISSVSFIKNVQIDFSKSIRSIDSVVLILIISAGVLAFVVIYNLTNININERKRELATIKLLGFYNIELASYIYRENIILTIIGSTAGIFMGILLNTYIITTAEINVMMFYRKIDPIYFIYSVLLTIFFSIIVNLAMYNRFDKIDMIESLKSGE